jgi:lactoylglutathione lyase
MHYLHTMLRVSDPEATLRFFELLGLKETRRMESESGRYTLIFLAADEDHRGDGERGIAERPWRASASSRSGWCAKRCLAGSAP